MTEWKSEMLSGLLFTGIVLVGFMVYQSVNQPHPDSPAAKFDDAVLRLEQLTHDSDRDGIPDRVEQNGTYARALGLNPPPTQGARDLYVDVYREYGTTWFNETVEHSLIDYFATAPVLNADGTDGVRLHLHQAEWVQDGEAEFNAPEPTVNYKVRAYFVDESCLRSCEAVGYATSMPPRIVVAAKPIQPFGFDRNSREELEQRWLRHVFMHDDHRLRSLQHDFALPHVRVYTMQLCCHVATVLMALSHRAYGSKHDSASHVPDYSDAFRMFYNDDAMFKRRKTWSIYRS